MSIWNSKPSPRGYALTLLGSPTCETCMQVKAALSQLDLAGRSGISTQFVDLDNPGKVKVDFPVEVIPTLHFQFPDGRAFAVDAKEMAEQWGLEMWDPRAITTWINNAIKQHKMPVRIDEGS